MSQEESAERVKDTEGQNESKSERLENASNNKVADSVASPLKKNINSDDVQLKV